MIGRVWDFAAQCNIPFQPWMLWCPDLTKLYSRDGIHWSMRKYGDEAVEWQS